MEKVPALGGVTLEAINDPKELSAIPFTPWDFITYGLIAIVIPAFVFVVRKRDPHKTLPGKWTSHVTHNGARFNGETIMAFIKAPTCCGQALRVECDRTRRAHLRDTAWIAYVNKGSISDASGSTKQNWLESAFLEKQAGNWKIVFMHSTRVASPPK